MVKVHFDDESWCDYFTAFTVLSGYITTLKNKQKLYKQKYKQKISRNSVIILLCYCSFVVFLTAGLQKCNVSYYERKVHFIVAT